MMRLGGSNGTQYDENRGLFEQNRGIFSVKETQPTVESDLTAHTFPDSHRNDSPVGHETTRRKFTVSHVSCVPLVIFIFLQGFNSDSVALMIPNKDY